jgi:hypothetical protein
MTRVLPPDRHAAVCSAECSDPLLPRSSMDSAIVAAPATEHAAQ